VSEHHATVEWRRSGEFRHDTYSRNHTVRFDGIALTGRASPENIPPTSATGPGVDPEQAFVGSLSACHMLWFLALAAQRKWVVESYLDQAVGILDKTWMSRVTLRPTVVFSGKKPTDEEHAALHRRAHEKCFIANSVKTEVIVEPCLK
jgi:organic hydroperoxide reductase OsmC/OhrA